MPESDVPESGLVNVTEPTGVEVVEVMVVVLVVVVVVLVVGVVYWKVISPVAPWESVAVIT